MYCCDLVAPASTFNWDNERGEMTELALHGLGASGLKIGDDVNEEEGNLVKQFQLNPK